MQIRKGFTLIELLVVLFIISLLATMVVINVSSARVTARDTKRKADLRTIQTAIEQYAQKHGSYPKTQSVVMQDGNDVLDTNQVRGSWKVDVDSGCPVTIGGNSAYIANSGLRWIPEILTDNILSSLPHDPLPQNSTPNSIGWAHCYMYQSDGDNYVLSAWNTFENGPINAGDDMFSYAGFRESDINQQTYYCKNTNIEDFDHNSSNGILGFYNYSYTLTNVKCP